MSFKKYQKSCSIFLFLLLSASCKGDLSETNNVQNLKDSGTIISPTDTGKMDLPSTDVGADQTKSDFGPEDMSQKDVSDLGNEPEVLKENYRFAIHD